MEAYAQLIGVPALKCDYLWTRSHFVRKSLFYWFFIYVNKK